MGLDKSRSHDLCHFEQPFNLTSISVLRIAQSHNAPISLIYVVIVHNLFDLIEITSNPLVCQHNLQVQMIRIIFDGCRCGK